MSDGPERYQNLPAPGPFSDDERVRDLGDGLVLRRATEADVDALVEFNRVAQADPPDFRPDNHIAVWTRELMDGSHPTMCARDFLLVDDTARKRVASTLCLVSHQFRYDGIPLSAGQVEIVGTHPDYRRRGLVRAQMEVVHGWSAGRGQRMQVIDGIPWYYRQFGYEMALEVHGGRLVHRARLAAGVETGDPTDGVRVRDAREDDAGLLVRAYAKLRARSRLSCDHDEAFCAYEIARWTDGAGSLRERRFGVIEDERGTPLGILSRYPIVLQGWLLVAMLEIEEGVAWPRVLPAVWAELDRVGRSLAADGPDDSEFAGAFLRLGSDHPVYAAAPDRVRDVREPYAYYVRVPDLPGFLQHVAPALEQRLAASPLSGTSGMVTLSLYRSGVRFVLEAGRFAVLESWQPSTAEPGHARIPDLVFLQLLLGFRSLEELEAAFPDCVVQHDLARSLLQAWFPKQVSQLVLTD
ncbi:MAG: GNAT family N-acetyltransferase [Proteobacteria bacterium]|nr:GNAT family N-acetyltransferase [Pseudomonadota bacterium]